MNKSSVYEFKQLICFPTQMFSSTYVLKGNQIVLPEFYSKAYEQDEQAGIDGLFVEITNAKNEERKEVNTQYAFVY